MLKTFTAVLMIGLFASAALANDVVFSITRAELSCRSGGTLRADRVEIVFDRTMIGRQLADCEGLGEDDCKKRRAELDQWIQNTLTSPENYHLLQIGSGDRVKLDKAKVPTAVLNNTLSFEIVYSPYPGQQATVPWKDYLLSEDYVLVAKNISPDKPAPFLVKVEPNSSCEEIGSEIPKGAKFKEEVEREEDEKKTLKDYFSKPSSPGSPILKLDFSLQGAKRQQVLYGFNVRFRPWTRSRLGFGGQYELTPFFVETEYKINASAGDKKNVLNIGVLDFKLTRVFRDDGGEFTTGFLNNFPGVVLSLTPKIETEWHFKEVNGILEPRAALPINFYQSRGTTVQVTPFIGMEFGRKFKSEITKPDRWIGRGIVGASLTTNFLRKADKPLFSFQIDYIRRMFIRPEMSFGFDPDDKEVAIRESRRLREHWKGRFMLNMSELFAPFIEYEYGRVPPKFSLINSSFKSGIAFDVDLVWKKFR